MVLTAIVIGVGIQALALALAIRLYQGYKTLDLRTIHRRMAADIDRATGVGPLTSGDAPAGGRPTPAPQSLVPETMP
jgi:hypothetical protein